MTIDRLVMAFAGAMILISVALSQLVHLYWLGLAVFVGLNMFQASLSGFCPLAIFLKKIGIKPGCAFR